MSTDNTVNSLASSFVAMAHAFEELPKVQAELADERTKLVDALNTIQRLELRLIDRAHELAEAHAATQKAEVQRDHAEEMFHEADDRANAFKRLFTSLQTDISALVKASEPPVEPVVQPIEAITQPIASEDHIDAPQAGQSATHPSDVYGSGSSPSASQSEPVGERAVDPFHGAPADTQSPSAFHSDQAVTSTDNVGVSVQPDPTPASASSSESAWSDSTVSEVQPQPEPGGFSMQPIQQEEGVPAAGTLYPVDPTASSTAGGGHSFETATLDTTAPSAADATTQASTPVDDVGYHNEPKIETGPLGWQAWDAWCSRMNAKFGSGRWPNRPMTSGAY